MEYKRLGDYIREVNVRNHDEKVTNLLGLSMFKQFRPSTSNIVGVDLGKYKVVNKNVFAFDPMSVIRVHKVPIAMNDSDSPIIVSPAYYTFECIDENKLDPRFLMMWFQRTEFDRYADFKSDSAVRGGYDWNELCDTYIYLPSIERQREIVEEYETLSRRIRLNEQMIEKLEATAQALYRKMFVDGIDKENLPEGWRMRTLDDICIINPKLSLKINTAAPFFDMDSLPTRGFFIDKVRYREFGSGMKFQNDDVLFARITPCMENGKAAIISDLGNEETAFGSTEFIVLRGRHQKLTSILATLVRNEDFREYAKKQMKGTDGRQRVEASALSLYEMVIPGNSILADIENDLSKLYIDMHLKTKENSILSELQSLLLAKMGNLKQ